MENHFGKGLLAGLEASCANTASQAADFCNDYKRGFVLGYSQRIVEKPVIVSSARGRRGS